jgi:phospholipase C
VTKTSLLAVLLVAACNNNKPMMMPPPTPPVRKAGSCDGPCPAGKIDHVVVIVQENHTFDSYFGRYCTAATGSAPTCNNGPACCEAGPATDPTGAMPVTLDDADNGAYDPDHAQDCELAEMNGGKMDGFVTGQNCSDPRNFAYASGALIKPYWDLAAKGALADRYFQPIAGQSSSNDMYLVRAQFVFKDNAYEPDAIGAACGLSPTKMEFMGPTIGDVLDGAGVSWSFYAEGYQNMVTAQKTKMCPAPPDDCGFGVSLYPCIFDPGDIPIDYYANYRDNPKVLRDYAQFATDLSTGKLPQVVFVRGAGFRSEHPGLFDKISTGTTFVDEVMQAVAKSDYAPDTLVLLTWDEGGGFFDHIAPPPDGVDGQPYGTRVGLIASGPFARKNFVSHVTMEHSSIVRFIEWNWLGGKTGQLGTRDGNVANIGSLLDPKTTGTPVPEKYASSLRSRTTSR